VSCDEDDGKCPQFALELSSNTLNGYLIAQVMNSTAPVAGRRKVRALPRKKLDASSKRAAVAGEKGAKDKSKRRLERREF
jgi:hypothetical protein